VYEREIVPRAGLRLDERPRLDLPLFDQPSRDQSVLGNRPDVAAKVDLVEP
jgi:hypothetical protein